MKIEPTQVDRISKRASRIFAFIDMVKVWNELNTEKGKQTNDVILYTDFAMVSFDPNQDNKESYLDSIVTAYEEKIVDPMMYGTENSEYVLDGPFVMIPKALIQSYDTDKCTTIHGMVLFVDSVKGMTVGTYSQGK